MIATNREQFVCPFCGEVLYEQPQLQTVGPDIEQLLGNHFVAKHPIKRRLHRKTRLALRKLT